MTSVTAARFDRFESTVRAWRPSTWLLGAAVMVLGWNVTFAMPSYGLDPSWWAGLSMATDQGKQFGTEVVFTYGPLGFLKLPFLWETGLASLAFVYGVGVNFGLATALVWTLRPRVGAPLACLVAFLMMGLLPIEAAVGIAALAGFALISERPPRYGITLLVTGGAVFAAAESLMKLSSGPVVVLVLLIGLIGARAGRRQLGTFIGVYLISFFAFWVITGQNIGNLPDFAKNSIQIVLGYSEAMAVYNHSDWVIVFMALGTALTVLWSSFGGHYRDRRARIAGAAIALVVGAAMYKQGVVRVDGAHVGICFAGLAVLWVATPATRRWNYILLAGLAGLMAASINNTGVYGTNLDVLANVKQAKTEVVTLASPSKKRDLLDNRRFALRSHYALEPEILSDLEGRTVSVEPSEIAVAWAFEMDWSPLPVFQNYSAYTTALDELNVDELESPDGPERILRSTLLAGVIDGRNPNWDPPGQAIATLCNFVPTTTAANWQVLGRTADRCGPEIPIGKVESAFGETVEVPAPGPGEVVFAKVEGTEPSGLEALRNLVYKAPARVAEISNGAVFRLVTSVADDGLLLASGRRVADDDGVFSQVPDTGTIRISGGSGDLEYDFYRMRVLPPKRAELLDR